MSSTRPPVGQRAEQLAGAREHGDVDRVVEMLGFIQRGTVCVGDFVDNAEHFLFRTVLDIQLRRTVARRFVVGRCPAFERRRGHRLGGGAPTKHLRRPHIRSVGEIKEGHRRSAREATIWAPAWKPRALADLQISREEIVVGLPSHDEPAVTIPDESHRWTQHHVVVRAH